MKANLPKREPQILEFWRNIDLARVFVQKSKSRGKFIVHDGPPYANGAIHLGHAVNKILKDIINKVKLLDGYSVPFVPGWDCHGLPIELNVEKKLGKIGVKVTVEEFITACRQYAAEQMQVQIDAFRRLGVVAAWQNRYCTMDFKYEADIVRALGCISKNGYLVRGYKPVHWCIDCGSALAEAEVEYRDKVSPAIDVRFTVLNPEKFAVKNVSIPIWTTTPWTLPANEAVCLHPKLEYLLLKCGDEHLVILADLLDAVMQRYGVTDYQVVATYLGKDLQDIVLQHPLLDGKQVPVILGDYVTVDAGTGAVHTAPAHGQEDYEISLRYKLPVNNPVGPDGRFVATTPFFAKENVFAANEHIVAVLKEQGKLLHAAKLQHSYPHCWRHKTPLIFRATRQWFISMDKVGKTGQCLRELATTQIAKVNWLPQLGAERIANMVALRPDWCISRQRWWGVPIALFVHKETGEIHPDTWRLLDQVIIPKIEQEGIVYWHRLDAQEFLKKHAQGAKDYEKVTDILDVWFDSGVTHYCVLQQNKELQMPADLYIEGNDQYRGWFQSSLLTAVALYGYAPYKTVVSHGFTVDAHGHKMSKSLGNVISPQEIITKHGADVLRLWVASNYMHDDLAASSEIFARNIDAYRMLRNTARFLLGNLFDFNVQEDLVSPQKMLLLDRWAVAQILQLAASCREHYNLMQFHLACNSIQGVLATTISSFYFSVIKDRLYTMPSKSLGRRSAQTALFHMLETLLRLITPILSFTAEEIWQELKQLEQAQNNNSRGTTVFASQWYEGVTMADFNLATDVITMDDWDCIQKIRNAVNKELERLRIDGKIGSSLAAEVTLYCDAAAYAVLKKLRDDLRFILITSRAVVQELAMVPANVIVTEVPGLQLEVMPSEHKKCMRCWHYCADVGSNEHSELCSRCEENLFGRGETRFVA